ncbi:thioesterase II family protein [Streptomyces sp. L7]
MPQDRPAAAIRLVCLPYAGGSAAVYRTWNQLVPSDVAVCPVELPGRGMRIGEQPFSRLAPLVRALADAMEPLFDRPFALFGHSLGGLVAFELARLLRRRGWPVPCHLFVSASAAPARRREPVLHNASDAEVKARLLAFNGTPREGSGERRAHGADPARAPCRLRGPGDVRVSRGATARCADHGVRWDP